MNMFTLDKEIVIRLGFFLGVFVFMAAWEKIAPRRTLTMPKGTRWAHNLAITILNSGIARWIVPVSAVGMALLAREKTWGVFNNIDVSPLIAGFAAIAVFDLTIYTQHVLFHRVPLFWRLHRMHHTDLDIDVTTGARFHPLEIIISMGIKIGMVVILGAPGWSVLAFEIILNGTSMFNHSNIYLDPSADGIVRLFVVTPDMHRVHHSVVIRETDSNFGFNFPWWDRLFGTYRDQPAAGHDSMTIGLAGYREKKWLTLPWMMIVPFVGRYR